MYIARGPLKRQEGANNSSYLLGDALSFLIQLDGTAFRSRSLGTSKKRGINAKSFFTSTSDWTNGGEARVDSAILISHVTCYESYRIEHRHTRNGTGNANRKCI